jgi:hypothetical protein
MTIVTKDPVAVQKKVQTVANKYFYDISKETNKEEYLLRMRHGIRYLSPKHSSSQIIAGNITVVDGIITKLDKVFGSGVLAEYGCCAFLNTKDLVKFPDTASQICNVIFDEPTIHTIQLYLKNLSYLLDVDFQLAAYNNRYYVVYNHSTNKKNKDLKHFYRLFCHQFIRAIYSGEQPHTLDFILNADKYFDTLSKKDILLLLGMKAANGSLNARYNSTYGLVGRSTYTFVRDNSVDSIVYITKNKTLPKLTYNLFGHINVKSPSFVPNYYKTPDYSKEVVKGNKEVNNIWSYVGHDFLVPGHLSYLNEYIKAYLFIRYENDYNTLAIKLDELTRIMLIADKIPANRDVHTIKNKFDTFCENLGNCLEFMDNKLFNKSEPTADKKLDILFKAIETNDYSLIK